MIKKLFNKDSFNYFFIFIYTILLVIMMLGYGNLYGSVQDWLSQHCTIPEYFRTLFYETGRMDVNMAFNLGGGQNIYNFSYYGLFSPIFLISYLFPFIDMVSYVMIISVILYIMTGILFYKFLRNNKFNKGLCMFLSLLIVSISPINFHMHHHIMFVSYIPYLILSLMGVDKYISSNKSWLLILGTFLVIMTNYYYSVCSLVVIFIYGIYKIINDKFDLKRVFKYIIRLGISIFMSGILLIPTLYTVVNSGREGSSSVSLGEIFIPRFSEILYGNYTIGISAIFIVGIIGVILSKKCKKCDLFLVISVMLFTICPLFTYILNGGLYIRGKVLIPFILLYLYLLGKFISYLFKNNINYRYLVIINIISSIFIFLSGYDEIIYYIIDLVLSLIFIYLGVKYKRCMFIYIYTFVVILGISIGSNMKESYVSLSYYNSIDNKDIDKLVDIISNDKGYYRVINDNVSKEVSNKIYNSNYYTTSMYSSLYNDLYRSFYNKYNNIRYRNYLIQAGSNNSLFNSFMGVKYIISEYDIDYYDLVSSSGDYKLYYNNNYYPLVYISKRIGSIDVSNNLSFPYNLEYLMNYTIVNDLEEDYYTNIYEYWDSNIDNSYEFILNEDGRYSINLDNELVNKVLFIKFDMNYNNSCSEGDQTISINGVVNKLTCRSWRYHNGNNSFEYVISDNNIDKLDIVISKGKYDISNVKLYVMDKVSYDNYIEVNNLYINNADSEISFDIDNYGDRYIVTSFPYDEGFSAYVDGIEVEGEIVNEAFYGFKVSSGSHNIVIKYVSPYYNIGFMFSIIGFVLYGMLIVLENKRCKLIS